MIRHVALVSLLLLGACASSPPAPSTKQAKADDRLQALMPLAVGNSWTYRTRHGTRFEENTVRIVEERGGFFHDDQRGAFAFDGEGIRDARRYLVLSPLVPGRTWESLLPDGSRERYEIVSTDAQVEVPAGRFEDVVVVRGETPVEDGASLRIEWSWAPHVGLVKVDTSAVLADGSVVPQTTLELLRYEVSR